MLPPSGTQATHTYTRLQVDKTQEAHLPLKALIAGCTYHETDEEACCAGSRRAPHRVTRSSYSQLSYPRAARQFQTGPFLARLAAREMGAGMTEWHYRCFSLGRATVCHRPNGNSRWSISSRSGLPTEDGSAAAWSTAFCWRAELQRPARPRTNVVRWLLCAAACCRCPRPPLHRIIDPGSQASASLCLFPDSISFLW